MSKASGAPLGLGLCDKMIRPTLNHHLQNFRLTAWLIDTTHFESGTVRVAEWVELNWLLSRNRGWCRKRTLVQKVEKMAEREKKAVTITDKNRDPQIIT